MKTLAPSPAVIRAACLLCFFIILSTRLATAEIIYTDVAPDIENEWDTEFIPEQNSVVCVGSSTSLDLDANGIVDVTFSSSCGIQMGHPISWNHRASPSFNVVTDNGFAAKLNAGEDISSASKFEPTDEGGILLEEPNIEFPIPPLGNWITDGQNKFLGLRFDIDGDNHFGWLRLSVGGQRITIHDYAYETRADTPITAGVVPEPSSLLLGALGALGLLLRRRSASR